MCYIEIFYRDNKACRDVAHLNNEAVSDAGYYYWFCFPGCECNAVSLAMRMQFRVIPNKILPVVRPGGLAGEGSVGVVGQPTEPFSKFLVFTFCSSNINCSHSLRRHRVPTAIPP